MERWVGSLAPVVRHRDHGGERNNGADSSAYASHPAPSDYDRWLDREETERLPVDLLRPFESEAMEMREANPKVNNARNNGPEMLERFLVAAESGQLPL